MGKKGGWFSVVKKALSPDSKDKDQLKNPKSKKGLAKEKNPIALLHLRKEPPLPPPTVEETKSDEVIESDLDKNEALPTAEDEEAVAPPEAGLLKYKSFYPGKSMEEIAAIRIQVVFRGFLARRELRALRGLERLKSLIEGQSVKRQSTTTLKCMQNLAHLQSQIRARRIRMSEENQALCRQLQQKHDKDLERLRLGKEWDVSMQSKKQIEANLQSKQEATMRRERALAYSFSHQTKKNSRSVNPSFHGPKQPSLGMELAGEMDGIPAMGDEDGERGGQRPCFSEEHGKSKHRGEERSDRSPSEPPIPVNGTTSNPLGRSSAKAGDSKTATDYDSKSTRSVQSRPQRRHSIGGASVGDGESIASSSPVPSYMTATKSTKARSKPASPLGVVDNAGAPEKGSGKKRLSFPGAPPAGTRRHSVPGKIESSSEKSGVTQA